MIISTKTFNEHPERRTELLGLLRMFGKVKLDFGMVALYHLRSGTIDSLMLNYYESTTILSTFKEKLVGIISYNYLPKLSDVLEFFKERSYSLSCYLYCAMRLYYTKYTHLKISEVKIPFVHNNKCAPEWINILVDELLQEHERKGHQPDDSFFNVNFTRPRDNIAESIAGIRMEEYFGIGAFSYQALFTTFYKTEAVLITGRFFAGFTRNSALYVRTKINNKFVKSTVTYNRDYASVSKDGRKWVVTLQNIKT